MGTNLLVLDDLKENGPRDVIGVHSALDDVALVYALNQHLGWGLSRLAQDHVVRLKDREQHHVVYAWRDDFTDIHLLITLWSANGTRGISPKVVASLMPLVSLCQKPL